MKLTFWHESQERADHFKTLLDKLFVEEQLWPKGASSQRKQPFRIEQTANRSSKGEWKFITQVSVDENVLEHIDNDEIGDSLDVWAKLLRRLIYEREKS